MTEHVYGIGGHGMYALERLPARGLGQFEFSELTQQPTARAAFQSSSMISTPESAPCPFGQRRVMGGCRPALRSMRHPKRIRPKPKRVRPEPKRVRPEPRRVPVSKPVPGSFPRFGIEPRNLILGTAALAFVGGFVAWKRRRR